MQQTDKDIHPYLAAQLVSTTFRITHDATHDGTNPRCVYCIRGKQKPKDPEGMQF